MLLAVADPYPTPAAHPLGGVGAEAILQERPAKLNHLSLKLFVVLGLGPRALGWTVGRESRPSFSLLSQRQPNSRCPSDTPTGHTQCYPCRPTYEDPKGSFLLAKPGASKG